MCSGGQQGGESKQGISSRLSTHSIRSHAPIRLEQIVSSSSLRDGHQRSRRTQHSSGSYQPPQTRRIQSKPQQRQIPLQKLITTLKRKPQPLEHKTTPQTPPKPPLQVPRKAQQAPPLQHPTNPIHQPTPPKHKRRIPRIALRRPRRRRRRRILGIRVWPTNPQLQRAARTQRPRWRTGADDR